jgi:hypothetical protein
MFKEVTNYFLVNKKKTTKLVKLFFIVWPCSVQFVLQASEAILKYAHAKTCELITIILTSQSSVQTTKNLNDSQISVSLNAAIAKHEDGPFKPKTSAIQISWVRACFQNFSVPPVTSLPLFASAKIQNSFPIRTSKPNHPKP